MPPDWLWLVLAFVALMRLMELVRANRAARRLTAMGAKWVPEDGYGLLVAVHVLMFGGVLAEATLAPWATIGWWTFVAILLFALGAGLRLSATAALGVRWSTRVYTLPGQPLVERGPYRWMRHPIYVGVFLELMAIPMLAGLWLTTATVALLHVVALRRRIQVEEEALGLRPA